jgi:hypothetical protein
LDVEATDLGWDNTGPLTEFCNLDKGCLAADDCTSDNDNDQVQGSQKVRKSPNNTKRLNKRGGGFYQQQNDRGIID